MSKPEKSTDRQTDAAPIKPGSPWAKPAPPPPTIEPAASPATGAAGSKERTSAVEEIGGPEGPEPTRYGDWAIKGRVSDF